MNNMKKDILKNALKLQNIILKSVWCVMKYLYGIYQASSAPNQAFVKLPNEKRTSANSYELYDDLLND